jgi:hypothetical protein
MLLIEWQKILINWEIAMFWTIFGVIVGWIGGWFTSRYFYVRTGKDLTKIRDEIFAKIDETSLSEEGKAHLKAQTAAALKGVSYNFPWEAEFAKELIGEESKPGKGIKKLNQ